MERRSKVLDTGAFLNSNFLFVKGIVPPSVVEEVKSKKDVILSLIEDGYIRVVKPEEWAVGKVKAVAEKMGEIGKLSKTDVDVLALALQENAEVVSDDFHVQNVAKYMGLKVSGVTGEIREVRRWVKKCQNCGRIYHPTYKGKRCPKCGGKLIYSSK